MSTDQTPQDHAAPDTGEAKSEGIDLEDNIKRRSTWLRLLFMIVFLALYALSRFVLFAAVALQFLWVLLTGETNDRIRDFGQSLATYTYQIVLYLTFNSEDKPFPFDKDWPDAAPE